MHSPEYLLQAQEKLLEYRSYLGLCMTLVIVLITCNGICWNIVFTSVFLWVMNIMLSLGIGYTCYKSREAYKLHKECLSKMGKT